jgi:Heterokaryon incompatibility protein (HET)
MRLLNTSSLKLEFFADEDRIPPYAILSHTWSDGEVTYQEMEGSHEALKERNGFKKIEQAAEIARLNKLEWIWADTCCIDKKSSAELTEAINCMFSLLHCSLLD